MKHLQLKTSSSASAFLGLHHVTSRQHAKKERDDTYSVAYLSYVTGCLRVLPAPYPGPDPYCGGPCGRTNLIGERLGATVSATVHTMCKMSSAWRQKGPTGYCFKYIDRPFCL